MVRNFAVAAVMVGMVFGSAALVAGFSAEKVFVCHKAGKKFIEISVDDNAVPAHLAHGDQLSVTPGEGECGGLTTPSGR